MRRDRRPRPGLLPQSRQLRLALQNLDSRPRLRLGAFFCPEPGQGRNRQGTRHDVAPGRAAASVDILRHPANASRRTPTASPSRQPRREGRAEHPRGERHKVGDGTAVPPCYIALPQPSQLSTPPARQAAPLSTRPPGPCPARPARPAPRSTAAPPPPLLRRAQVGARGSGTPSPSATMSISTKPSSHF